MKDFGIKYIVDTSRKILDRLSHGESYNTIEINKVASEVLANEGLNKDQVSRISESVNHVLFQKLHNKDLAEFELMDTEKIASELKISDKDQLEDILEEFKNNSSTLKKVASIADKVEVSKDYEVDFCKNIETINELVKTANLISQYTADEQYTLEKKAAFMFNENLKPIDYKKVSISNYEKTKLMNKLAADREVALYDTNNIISDFLNTENFSIGLNKMATWVNEENIKYGKEIIKELEKIANIKASINDCYNFLGEVIINKDEDYDRIIKLSKLYNTIKNTL
jgi:hypothetical protein